MKKLSLIGILSVFLIVFALGVSATVTWNTPIVVIGWNEDNQKTIDLTSYVNISLKDGDIVYSIDTISLDSNIVASLSGSILTLTPASNWYGNAGSIDVIIHDNDAMEDTETIDLTVNPVNDAPTTSNIPDFAWVEETTFTFDLDDYFSDVDVGDDLTFTYDPDPISRIEVSIDESINEVTFTPEEDWIGIKKDITFTASDGTLSVTSNKFNLIIGPKVCDEGEIGELDIDKIDFDEDDFVPGGTMDIEVDVGNDFDEDLDVVVEVFIYNLDQDNEVVGVETDEIEIEHGRSETFDIVLEIPTEDMDVDDYYVLYVKAYEDGNEEVHCEQDAEKLELNLEKHDVIVQEIDFAPSVVECGEKVSVTVDLKNIGKSNEDDVYVQLKDSRLGLDVKSEKFDIDKLGDSDDDYTARMSFTVPTNTNEGTYNIEATVYFDDEDESSSEFADLEVVCGDGSDNTEDGVVELNLLQTQFSMKPGDQFSVPVSIVNNGDSSVLFTLDGSAGSWGDGDVQTISLGAGNSKTVYLDFEIDSSTSEGTYSGLISVISGGSTVGSKGFSVNVEGDGMSGITGGSTFEPTFNWKNKMSDTFWIIGDIVLVLIAIYFVVLILRRR